FPYTPLFRSQAKASGVRPGGAVDHRPVARRRQPLLLEGRRKDTYAQRLAEDEAVARSGAGVALEASRIDQADRNQAVDRLDRVDGVSASNRDAGGGAYRLPAFEDAPDGLGRQPIDRHR